MFEITLARTSAAVALLIGLYKLLKIGGRHPRMPPGPPTMPILGNLHQVPITGLYKQSVSLSNRRTLWLIQMKPDLKTGVRSTEESSH
jgi:hypothetical protein